MLAVRKTTRRFAPRLTVTLGNPGVIFYVRLVILYGDKKRPVDILHEYCRTERFCNRPIRRIGF